MNAISEILKSVLVSCLSGLIFVGGMVFLIKMIFHDNNY